MDIASILVALATLVGSVGALIVSLRASRLTQIASEDVRISAIETRAIARHQESLVAGTKRIAEELTVNAAETRAVARGQEVIRRDVNSNLTRALDELAQMKQAVASLSGKAVDQAAADAAKIATDNNAQRKGEQIAEGTQ